ncbi:hypothetical protein [Roseivivax sediminis]|uniref:Uncharacterized protein n=1 Tax=Roseivivax sediminis TaxID=936889 RepID=A0A1I1SJV8_9RHOB|nr:hypothetical protein [Roseivivax sediminis]SFD46726.1 hypothetical protein SAMN04515678_101201 [Roseivivax sediminis]
MRTMIAFAAVLLIGIAVVALQPILAGAPIDNADAPGVFPEWLAPVGYFIALVGAVGLFVAWMRAKSTS